MIDTLVSNANAIKLELIKLGFALPVQNNIETNKLKQIHADFSHCVVEICGQSHPSLFANVQTLVWNIACTNTMVGNLDDVYIASKYILRYLKKYNHESK